MNVLLAPLLRPSRAVAGLACLLLPGGGGRAFRVPKALEPELKNRSRPHFFRGPRPAARLLPLHGPGRQPAGRSPRRRGSPTSPLEMRQGRGPPGARLSQRLDGLGAELWLQTDRVPITGRSPAADRRLGSNSWPTWSSDPRSRPRKWAAREASCWRRSGLARRTEIRGRARPGPGPRRAPLRAPVWATPARSAAITREDSGALPRFVLPAEPLRCSWWPATWTGGGGLRGRGSARRFGPGSPAPHPGRSTGAPAQSRPPDRPRGLCSPSSGSCSGMISARGPDFFAIQVANYILGGGGFASRLIENVRSRGGLTYDAATLWSYGLRARHLHDQHVHDEHQGRHASLMLRVVGDSRDQGEESFSRAGAGQGLLVGAGSRGVPGAGQPSRGSRHGSTAWARTTCSAIASASTRMPGPT